MIKEKTKIEVGWNFDNSYVRLPKLYHNSTNPTPVSVPRIIILNESLAETLGLSISALYHEDTVGVFTGNHIPDGAEPIAQAYAGHQYGHFTMLGDGRAILLGEQITPQKERVDIQLKGSGRTPFSRRGDGRAALGPMLREYIISEAMYALGIPTTRSLAVATTGDMVYRETPQPGAILTRIASSHLRVGTFQFSAKWGTIQERKALVDYAMQRHFSMDGSNTISNPYLTLLQEVIKRQAELISKWQLVGFIHGVMNTDNMSISGETIDYGPCAFMDTYDPSTVFSSIDIEGRYAYKNQPTIGQWNLTRFAETLIPFLHEDQEEAINIANDELTKYNILFQENWLKGMRSKLGIYNQEEEDDKLVNDLLTIMYRNKADFTNTFRDMTVHSLGDTEKFKTEIYKTEIYKTEEFKLWEKCWQDRLSRQKQTNEEVNQLMRRSNPSIIPRNHRVEEALEAAVKDGDFHVIEKLLKVLSKPYDYTYEQEEYTNPPAPTACRYRTFCGT